jgi:hypothetical protein
MKIQSINNYQTPSFQGRLKSGMLTDMLKNFSEKELAEYKTLISKAENVNDGRLFGILKGRRYDHSAKNDYFEYYQFVEEHPETENTLAPLSRCIKKVLSEKVSLIKIGYKEEKDSKAIVDVILEPLRKLYGEG